MMTNDTCVLAIDPGLRSGIARWDSFHEPVFRETDVQQTWTELSVFSHEMATTGRAGVIVIEKFTITAQTAQVAQAPWSLELIGVARYFSKIFLGRELVEQTPAQAKRFASDARLKHLGWYSTGVDFKGHANDAARHLMLYAAGAGMVDIAELADI